MTRVDGSSFSAMTSRFAGLGAAPAESDATGLVRDAADPQADSSRANVRIAIAPVSALSVSTRTAQLQEVARRVLQVDRARDWAGRRLLHRALERDTVAPQDL